MDIKEFTSNLRAKYAFSVWERCKRDFYGLESGFCSHELSELRTAIEFAKYNIDFEAVKKDFAKRL